MYSTTIMYDECDLNTDVGSAICNFWFWHLPVMISERSSRDFRSQAVANQFLFWLVLRFCAKQVVLEVV